MRFVQAYFRCGYLSDLAHRSRKDVDTLLGIGKSCFYAVGTVSVKISRHCCRLLRAFLGRLAVALGHFSGLFHRPRLVEFPAGAVELTKKNNPLIIQWVRGFTSMAQCKANFKLDRNAPTRTNWRVLGRFRWGPGTVAYASLLAFHSKFWNSLCWKG